MNKKIAWILMIPVCIIALYFLLPIPNLNIYGYVYTITVVSIFTTILHIIVLVKAVKKLTFRRVK